MRVTRRQVLGSLAALLLLCVLGAAYYAWSIDRQYGKARTQAEVVKSRVSTESGSPSLDDLPQLTLDLIQLEEDLRELDRRVDRPIIGGIARNAPFVGEAVKSSQELLDLGIELTEISRETSEIANEIRDAFETNGFMGDEPAVGPTWLEVVQARRDDINELERRYDAALQQRAEIDDDQLPGRAMNTLNTVDELLEKGTNIRDEYFHLFPLLDTAFGADEDAHYLILLQNGQELRQSGGFVGTYGMMTISNGRISELEINPISTLNQAYVDERNGVLPAPAPIVEYLGQEEWLPHDANWAADFPLVAAELADMYDDTGWPELQGIIAVNDSAVQAVLEVVGPYDVQFEDIAEVVSPESFLDLIQSYRDGSELHKAFVGILGRSLIDQVIEAEFDTKKAVFWSMRDSANEREIQVAMLDPVLQAEVQSRGWDGALVPDPAIETLGFTISNVTGNKASDKIWVNAALEVSASEVGDRRNVVWTVVLTHFGDPDGNLEFNGFHRTWLQVYLPKSATLTGSSLDPAPSSMTNEPRAIGFHIELYTGEQETLTVEFDLPSDVDSLLLRRQSGLHNLDYHVSGGSGSDCRIDQDFRLDHDYLVDFAACRTGIHERGQVALAD